MILECTACNTFLKSKGSHDLQECSCNNQAFIRGNSVGAKNPNKIRRYVPKESLDSERKLKDTYFGVVKELGKTLEAKTELSVN